MSTCPRCAANLTDDNRFCPACGAAQPGAPAMDDGVDATTPMETRDVPPTPSAPTGSTSAVGIAAGTGERFIPGAMVANRYRIVGLLGRGGMGEVYRADDLKLGQPVALKFLPPGLEQNPARLERFLSEVRTALKVTHPNVCRVFDIGEVDGHHYLSMEFVDGEDLSSLLRRIGRLPHERAVQVARQICAGLAAAHDQGILHRDLKPANVMIDGRGQVRLTDFGLAGLADAIGQDEITSGTPGYMAPEQLTGREVTVRSDIYALGLLLYELFTGRQAFSATTVAEFTRLHTESQPSSLSQHVDGIDPAVERTVLHCLEKDPADRPTSALAVSAGLPGGDPLAAALAAGETPSPELVAEAGNREGMKPGRAILLGLCALLVALGAARWTGIISITNFLPLEKRPEVLVDRAQTILDELGYGEPTYSEPVDDAWGLIHWTEIRNEVAAADSSERRWENLRERPDAGAFWYRQSPQLLYPKPLSPPIFVRGTAKLMNPIPSTPGEAMVLLDLDGRLRRLEVLPKRFSTREPEEPDWGLLFELADLDPDRFTQDRPRYQRYMAPDLRRAWVGTRADAPDVELRVEAGAFEGRPMLFNVTTSASLESLGDDPEPRRPDLPWFLTNTVQPAFILVVAITAALFSRRNLVQGRMDRRGSIRFAFASATLFLLAQALRSHLLTTSAWADEIWPIIVGAIFVGFISWCLYAAAEPLGRRVWPTMFVASSRLLSRPRIHWRDPVIGASVLIGVLTGAIRQVIGGPLWWQVRSWSAGAPQTPFNYDLDMMGSYRLGLSSVFDASILFVFTLLLAVTLIGIRRLVKHRTLSIVLALIAWFLIDGGTGSLAYLPFMLVRLIISMVVLLRWGALAFFVNLYAMSLVYMARGVDYSVWYAKGPTVALLVLVALVVYGTWAAIGRPAKTPSTGQ